MLIDTHSHIYLPEFDTDRKEVVDRAKANGVKHIILPNVDRETVNPMLELEQTDPSFFHSAIGLHPTCIDKNFKNELEWVKTELKQHKYCAVGEIGIDLYWDKTFRGEQIKAFEQQLQWAIEYSLPVIIHQRDAFEDTLACVKQFNCPALRGVFHSFGGTLEQANQIVSLGGFYLGINGVVTFKNSKLDQLLALLSPEILVLETDAPYLTPVPHRGKRNESAYVGFVAEKLADIFQLTTEEIIAITGKNSKDLFHL